jgi:pimeloyl-ACP methyl ester carboxylesterase
MPFTPAHRGGSGPPLVLLHGFLDTWRTWELVLPALERRHEVLAPTLAGHAGGPVIDGPITDDTLADHVERALDDAGIATAHIAGNSLGGFVALTLAARGRARSVVALAPAGGWADDAHQELLAFQRELVGQLRQAAPYAVSLTSTPEGRRRATRLLTVNHEHIPAELLAHQLRAAAAAPRSPEMLEYGRSRPWQLDAEHIHCRVRVIWGTEDALLPWPSAAARYRNDWLPHADWVILDGVGHYPQLDVPLETAQLILGHTSE